MRGVSLECSQLGLNLQNTPMGYDAQSPERPRTLSPAGGTVIGTPGRYSSGYTVTAISLWGQFALRKTLLGQLHLFIFLIASGFFVVLFCAAASCAREKPEAPEAKQDSSPQIAPPRLQEHRFWDGTNAWLFAGTGAARTLDYFSTLNMRSRGRQEILLTNDVVDNHAAFAAIEAAGTGVSIGAAYLFHRSGHHKLERLTSIIHISAATTGSVRNYCLKTAHPAPASTP